jgi:hypothetical protein
MRNGYKMSARKPKRKGRFGRNNRGNDKFQNAPQRNVAREDVDWTEAAPYGVQ